MICAPHDGDRELERLAQMTAASPGFSGWNTLPPLERKTISALIAASGERRLSIYLLTRQAPDSNPDFAWARFSRFEFNILAASLVAAPGTDTLPLVLRSSNASAEVVPVPGEMESAALGVEPNAESR